MRFFFEFLSNGGHRRATLTEIIVTFCPKVRKTAFFVKIHPAPFLDFGAAEGDTVSCLPPPKAGGGGGGESLKKQGLARPKAVQQKLKKV